MPPAVEAWSSNHWTAREFPTQLILKRHQKNSMEIENIFNQLSKPNIFLQGWEEDIQSLHK